MKILIIDKLYLTETWAMKAIDNESPATNAFPLRHLANQTGLLVTIYKSDYITSQYHNTESVFQLQCSIDEAVILISVHCKITLYPRFLVDK